MDLAQYLSVLKDSSIYFSPLSAFEDPFEGSSPYNLSLASILERQHSNGEIDKAFLEISAAGPRLVRSILRNATCVSCWHLSEHESDAMWKLYSRSNASIALKTTCGKLRAQMPESARFGKLNYVDFSTFVPPPGPFTYDPVFFKRKAFEHEKEMRIKLETPEEELGERMRNLSSAGGKIGKSVRVDLPSLVECLIVNPTAPQWLAECIRDVTKRYELGFEVRQSTLAQLPTY
jgi:hypothetical protein